MYRIGIDVGGTFTDLVAVDGKGRSTLAKAPSTPADPSLGVMDGLARLAEALGLERRALLAATDRIVHGTTVATNALLERKGAKVGLLTSEGHRDVIEMREGLKDDRYNLRMVPPVPLVPRHRRLGVRERVRPDGKVAVALDARSLAGAVAQLKRDDVESVAICFLHAYRNPKHERAAAAAVRKIFSGAYVSASSDVFPQIKEYERVSTTVVNAYVGPIVERYLLKLGARLSGAGYRGPVFIILSNGGVAPIREAVRLAAATVLSGPAGGVAGSRYAAELLESGNLIPFDMGGTSTDISLIVKGVPSISADRGVAGHRIALPSLDIVSLGAGGGSIARVDAGGVLHVGPESAGAAPGPACYGQGGVEPTVTDANLVLGYLDPGNFLGGRMALDRAAAEKAVNRLVRPLGIDRVKSASGVYRVVNTRMAEGIRLVSVRRGVDPRDYALLAFGGAAGLHVSAVARMLELKRIVVPRVASVLSAWGMLATDIRYDVSRTHIGDGRALSAASLRRLFDAMEAEGRRRLARSFRGRVRCQRSADIRYGEQIFEINVPLDGVAWRRADVLAQIAERFHRRHEELYTYALRDRDIVLVNARVAAIGELPALPAEPHLPRRRNAAPLGRRRVYLDGWREADIYGFDALARGQKIAGPALIESATTTVLLQRGDVAVVTPQGWLDIAVG